MKEGSFSRKLAFDCGHGDAQKEHTMKTEETYLRHF